MAKQIEIAECVLGTIDDKTIFDEFFITHYNLIFFVSFLLKKRDQYRVCFQSHQIW